MEEKSKQIIDTIKETLPKLTEVEKEKLLSFSEGMAFMKKQEQEKEEQEQRPA